VTLLSRDDLEALRAFSTPTICNAIETFEVRPRTEGFMDSSIACRFPELGRLAGYAVTLRVTAAASAREEMPPAAVWAQFDRLPAPRVVVVEDLDWPAPIGSYWGEVNAATYAALGAAGAVTNGGVRDLAEVRATGFHFFSSCVLVSHAHTRVVEAGATVTVGGLALRPGDLLHGDEHGVTSIPIEIARELPDACRRIEDRERDLIEYARSGSVQREELERLYRQVD
jgi:regulator of RNase E activity RraA